MNCERVLVVEDDPDLRSAIIECLEPLGMVVVACATGRAALEHLETASPAPDLVLLDMMLADVPGEAILRLLEEPRWRSIPVAAMSGHPRRRYAYLQRVGAFLEKPFDLAVLNETVTALCGTDASATA